MRKGNGGSWRSIVGAVGVCFLAYGLSLQGAPTGSASKISIDQKDLAAPSSSHGSKLQATAPLDGGDKRRGAKAIAPSSVWIDGEVLRTATIVSVVEGGGAPQSLNMDSGTAGSYAAEGVECTCDADCAVPVNQCTRANCLNGECREIPRPNNAWCDLDATWCTQDRCDGGGTCKAGTLSRCVHECDEDSNNTGDTCSAAGSCTPGVCVPVGVCNEGAQRCELDPDVGRCCKGLTCSYEGQAACEGDSGLWLRLADTDDTNDSCICPTYSSGIAPRGTAGLSLGPVRPPFEVCAGAKAEHDDPLDPIRRCIDPVLDCAKRCSGGTNAGDICTTDPECPESFCGFDVCVDEPNHCHEGFEMVGDDYKMVNGSYLHLRQLRMHGGVENSREQLVIQFFDNADPPQLIDAFAVGAASAAVNFNQRGGGNDYLTINFDCAPDCNLLRDEDARSEPVILPPEGWVVMRTLRNLGSNQEPGEMGNGSWVDTDAVDAGDVVLANDPTWLWIDDGPTQTLPPGASGILSFELVGQSIPDPKGACCDPDVPGACDDKNLWQCRECTRETDPTTRVCSESRDCGLTDFCIEPNFHGKKSRDDFANDGGDLCESDICNTGR